MDQVNTYAIRFRLEGNIVGYLASAMVAENQRVVREPGRQEIGSSLQNAALACFGELFPALVIDHFSILHRDVTVQSLPIYHVKQIIRQVIVERFITIELLPDNSTPVRKIDRQRELSQVL